MTTYTKTPSFAATAPRAIREELIKIDEAAKLLNTHDELILAFLELGCIEAWSDDPSENGTLHVYLSEIVECFEDWGEVVREAFNGYKAAVEKGEAQ